jgi:hypothetical protein
MAYLTARAFFTGALYFHSLIYLLYLILDIIGLFQTPFRHRSFPLGFYANVVWTGFNYINLMMTLILIIYTKTRKHFLEFGEAEAVQDDAILRDRSVETISNNGYQDFVESHLWQMLLFMCIIDAWGLGIDIAIYAEGRESNNHNNILFWKSFEVMSDFFMVFILDPLQVFIYLRRIHNFRRNVH